jgi:hypothetical protein
MVPARASRLNRFSPSCAVTPELSTIDMHGVGGAGDRNCHDLKGVEYRSDRVLVLYLGQVVESSASDKLYRQPAPAHDVACILYESEVPVHA